MKRKLSKLHLSKETLLSLEDDLVLRAAGANTTPASVCTCTIHTRVCSVCCTP